MKVGILVVVGVLVLGIAGVDLGALAALLVVGAIPVLAFAAMFGSKKLAESAGAVVVAGLLVATLWAGFVGWSQIAASGLLDSPGQFPPEFGGLLVLGLLGLLGVGVLLFVAKLRRALPKPSARGRPRARDRIVLADLDPARGRSGAAPRGSRGDELDLLGDDGDGGA